jgi:hypothetical protein
VFQEIIKTETNYYKRFLKNLTNTSLLPDEATLHLMFNNLNVEVLDKFHERLQAKLQKYHENTKKGLRPNLPDAFVEEKV